MLLLCTGGSSPSCLLLICIQGSLSGMPQSLEIALHTLFIQFLWRTFFVFIWCRTPTHGCCGRYNDLYRDKSGVLEQVIIIVFSLHLGEPLVLDLRNTSIHKSSIHCSLSRLSVLLLDCFWWVHIRLVILWFLIQWLVVLVYLSFLETSCFSWCFSLALGSMEFLIDSMP